MNFTIKQTAPKGYEFNIQKSTYLVSKDELLDMYKKIKLALKEQNPVKCPGCGISENNSRKMFRHRKVTMKPFYRFKCFECEWEQETLPSLFEARQQLLQRQGGS